MLKKKVIAAWNLKIGPSLPLKNNEKQKENGILSHSMKSGCFFFNRQFCASLKYCTRYSSMRTLLLLKQYSAVIIWGKIDKDHRNTRGTFCIPIGSRLTPTTCRYRCSHSSTNEHSSSIIFFPRFLKYKFGVPSEGQKQQS